MGITSIVSWIVFGLIIGALARFVMPGRQAMGWIMTILLGVVGSFAGGALSNLVFGSAAGLVRPSGWIMSILGAVIVLFVYSRMASAK